MACGSLRSLYFLHRNPPLSVSPQAVYYTEPCPQAIPPTAPSPPPSPISRARPALARVCTLTPAGRPLARASPAWTALPCSAPIQLRTPHLLCDPPTPPRLPLWGARVGVLLQTVRNFLPLCGQETDFSKTASLYFPFHSLTSSCLPSPFFLLTAPAFPFDCTVSPLPSLDSPPPTCLLF